MRGRSLIATSLVLLIAAACSRGGGEAPPAAPDVPAPDVDLESHATKAGYAAPNLQGAIPICERENVPPTGTRCGTAWCGADKVCVYGRCGAMPPPDFSACTYGCQAPGESGCACPGGEPIEQLWEYRATANRMIPGPAIMDVANNIWFVEEQCDHAARWLVSLTFDGRERIREAIPHDWYAPAVAVGGVLVSRSDRVAPNFEARDLQTGAIRWQRSIGVADLDGIVEGPLTWLESPGNMYTGRYGAAGDSVFLTAVEAVGQPPDEDGTPQWLVALDTATGVIKWTRGGIAAGPVTREDGNILVFNRTAAGTASLLAPTGEQAGEIAMDGELDLGLLATKGELAYQLNPVKSLETGETVSVLAARAGFWVHGTPQGYLDTRRVIGKDFGYSVIEPGSYAFDVLGFDPHTGQEVWRHKVGTSRSDRTDPIVTQRDTMLMVESKVATFYPDGEPQEYRATLFEMDRNAAIVQTCELPLDPGWAYLGYPLLRQNRLIVPARRFRWRFNPEMSWSARCSEGFEYGFRAFAVPDRDLSPIGWPARFGQHDGTRRALGPAAAN